MGMINKEDVSYTMEILENVSVDDIRSRYSGEVLIWITGAGEYGIYRYVLELRKGARYHEGAVAGATPNQACLYGLIDAVEQMNKPKRLYIVVHGALGFEKGFKGEGINGELFQELYRHVKKKGCSITEIRFSGGNSLIKSHIAKYNPNPQRNEDNKQKKEEYRKKYREVVYDECLQKVLEVLTRNHISEDIIEQVMTIERC